MNFDVMLGATYLGARRSHFLVWAPLAHTVQVHVVAPHERLVPLERGPHGYHQAVVDGVEPGSLYLYRWTTTRNAPIPPRARSPRTCTDLPRSLPPISPGKISTGLASPCRSTSSNELHCRDVYP